MRRDHPDALEDFAWEGGRDPLAVRWIGEALPRKTLGPCRRGQGGDQDTRSFGGRIHGPG
ncbi:hypothetical protein [Synechococcus sp. UW140]|uniref:hypothetical protein n=1 Tax=Synechococcus sp. UW140 TaxID=368503 RepID=UPI003137A932